MKTTTKKRRKIVSACKYICPCLAIVILIVAFKPSHVTSPSLKPIQNSCAYITDSVFGLMFTESGFTDKYYDIKLEHNYLSCKGADNGYVIVEDDKGFSYINNKGENIFNAHFNKAYFFSNGIAVVFHNEKPYHLSCNGEFLDNPGWERIKGFSGELAGVLHKDKWGFINTKGQLVIPNIYNDIIEPFSDGFAFVEDKKGNVIMINAEGKELITRNDIAFVYGIKDGKYIHIAKQVADTDGDGSYVQNILSLKNNLLFKDWFSGIKYLGNDLFELTDGNNRIVVNASNETISDIGATSYRWSKEYHCIEVMKDSTIVDPDGGSSINTRLYNYIDYSGKLKLDTWFSEIRDKQDGISLVSKNHYRYSPESKMIISETRYNFIDSNLQYLSKIWFDNAYSFSEGKAVVYKNPPGRSYGGTYGYIDVQGKQVIPMQFESANSFSDGLALVTKDNRSYQYIDKQGKVNTELKAHDASSFSHNHALIEFEYKQFGFINKKGQRLKGNYTDATPFELPAFFETPVATVAVDGKYGLTDTLGNWIIKPISKIPVEFHSKLALICVNDTFGYMNHEGKWAIEPRFQQARRFDKGKAAVLEFPSHGNRNPDYYEIDKQGQKIEEESFLF